jgi:hypothetical protein
MVHQLFRLANILKLNSILDLVPAAWTFDAELPEIKVKGRPLTPQEQSAVQGVLASALADDRRRKRTT